MNVISIRDRELFHKITQIIRQVLPDAKILLYGSAARDDRQPDSDYDVLILTDQPLPKAAEDGIEDALFALELDQDALISTAYYTTAQWNDPIREAAPFHQHVEKDAIHL